MMKVHPVSLGPDTLMPHVIENAFYPLGCLVAYAKSHHGGALQEAFKFGPITPRKEAEVGAWLETVDPDEPAIYVLSSYVWNGRVNARFARAVKARSPHALILVGGPDIPRRRMDLLQFFQDHPEFDVAARSEGEVTFAEILDAVQAADPNGERLPRVDLANVAGITFRDRDGKCVETPDRPRQKDLTQFPSPFLTGEFDHFIEGACYAPFETNRGCPYGCTFCDWGAATLAKIHQMSDERVFGEIEYAAKHHIGTVGFCDANFGILPRDVEIAKFCVEMNQKHGFPTNVGYTNAKTASPRLREIIATLRDAGLVSTAQISMQTVDATTLDNIKRANIKTAEYEKMIAFFHDHNIPIKSDMMIGLPGQNLGTVVNDLQFFFDRKVNAFTFATSLMPNAPMADPEYRERFKIVADETGHVVSTYSFSEADFGDMFDLCLAYRFLVRLGIAKYILYFMQLDRGAPAGAFLRAWLESRDNDETPISKRVFTDMLRRKGAKKDFAAPGWAHRDAEFLFGDLEAFYRELLGIYERELGVSARGDDVDTVLLAQRSVMPTLGSPVPRSVPVAHDVSAYFQQLKKRSNVGEGETRPLASFGPGTLEVPEQPHRTTYDHTDESFDLAVFELDSNMRL